ncbi:MAG: glycosyltransferase family 39 protein [Anaerolineae bacterium]|jgi:4-amino-4-deoxy-L-arabinose transferase-like glycosyltransferase|nr:glycosyltransferase family 39 protein [Anaerolineae bacterium]
MAFLRSQLDRDRGILFLLILIALLLAAPILTYPMGRDQGMYANIGQSILNGGLPFIDMWDIKPPVIYYIYAIAIDLFGATPSAIRLIDLITVPITMIALYGITRRLSDRRWIAIFAVILFPVFYFTETFASLSQNDAVVTLPMSLAVWCVVIIWDQPQGGRWAMIGAVCAGGLCALTLWFKHYNALFVAALVIVHGLRRWPRFPVREAIAFAVGGLPIGLIPLIYFLQTGVLEEILIVAQGTAQYNAQALTSLEAFVTQMSSYVLYRWQHWGIVIVLSAIGLVVIVWTQALRRWAIVIVWLVAGLLFVIVQAKGFDTHWIPMLPPLCLLGAVGLERLLRGRPILIPVILIMLLYGVLAKDTVIRAFPYLTGQISQVDYFRQFQGNDLKPWESLQVVRFLNRRTTPGDTLYVWGFRPEIYFLSGLRPATRFQAQFMLVGEYYPPEWKQENVDLLWAAMPPYVLVLQADYMPWVTGSNDDSATLLTYYKPLEDWLIANYERGQTIGDFLIWKRKF